MLGFLLQVFYQILTNHDLAKPQLFIFFLKHDYVLNIVVVYKNGNFTADAWYIYPVHNETIRESMTSNIEVLHVVHCTGKKMIKRNIS